MRRMVVLALCTAFACAFVNPKVFASEVKAEAIENVAEDAQAYGRANRKVTAEKGCSAKELQALFDLNKEGSYNLTIMIPAGTYNLNRTLYVYPNTKIIATGAKMVKQDRYGAMLEAALVNDDGGYDGNHDITVEGGIWDSKPIMNSAGDGTETFRFIHSNNIRIKNAVLRNVPEGSHLIVFAGVQNAEVINCKFYGYGNDGKGELSPKEAVQLDTVHSKVEVPTLQTVYWDDLPCTDITISGCEFYDFSRGIGSHTAVAGRLHSNVVIENNVFRDLSDSAIRLYNYKNTIVRNNTINNVKEGILAYTYMEDAEADSFFKPLNGKVGTLPKDYNITISKNTIKNVADADKVWGDGIRIIGKKGRLLVGVEVSENTIQSTSRYGIFATGAPKLTIGTKNKITDTKGHGILIEKSCDNSSIYGNTVSKVKDAGIAVYGSDSVSVYKNTVTAVNDAIYFLDSEKGIIGKANGNGNTVTSSKGNGIAISTEGRKNSTGCTSTKVEYNFVKSARLNGIFVYKTKKSTINRNSVKESGESGVLVSTASTNAKITNNTITKAKQNGIAVNSASKYAQVSNNKILSYGVAGTRSKCYGIIVYKSGGSKKNNTKVIKNSIAGVGKKTGRNGIQISESSYTTVSGNTVTKPDGTGIYLYKSKYCVVGTGVRDYNTIKSSKEHGIYATRSCDNTQISYNKITDAKQDGIGAYTSKLLMINGNTITANGNGISISTNGTSSKITGNTISSAGGNGVNVTSGSKKLTISGNTIRKYATIKQDASGIYVFKSGGTSSKAQTKVVNNKIYGVGSSTKKNAIKVSEAAYTTMQGNKITSPAGAGVYLYKSKNCTIIKNTITSAKSCGIKVTTACDNTKVTSNTVKKAADTAISLYQAPKSNVSNNKVTTTKRYRGIWVSNSNKSQIISNTVGGAKRSNAVLVTGSSGCRVTKNKIK